MFSRRKWLKFSLRSAIALMLTLVISACVVRRADESNSASTVADSSTAITVYTALEDDQIQNYLTLFQQEHPDIKVNTVRDSTGIVTAKLLAEKDNPRADVVWGLAVSSLLVADSQGMLEPYAPAGLERVRSQFRDERNPPHWVGIDAWMSAFCVNTVEMEKRNLPIPQSWADLTNPAYKNLIVMSNPASSGTGFLSVSAILQMMGEEKGWQYLDALHQNVAQYMHSGSRPCKAAGAGEYPIGISFDYRAVTQKNDGEPIEAVFPQEGSGWDIEANALVKKPQINPAAKTFLDWAITPAISQEYAKSFAVTAVKTDVPIPQGYPQEPLKQLINNDFNWAATHRDRILQEWTRRYDSKSEPKTS
ncbi:putative 2-aminoethylphosphonate ABC transporter substrate-binding protein [Gloeocapsa sp. BRSZ]|uniref:putative 2-aminoethylphosphonate ABC transporter substrate-binding protein n=1 Tax=Gloeocapsopsis sp. IPPAS B-1203 TaxID=2049454 RepID=UPI0025A0E55E|nr:putative 2-aminoethylphosphonate ABC transporter substrate-binding protein [Gloeocapsopsis sp. IPPAS B-1203]